MIRRANRGRVLVGMAALIAALTGVRTSADVPRLVHYQGKLRESGGALVNGTASLQFRLYGHPSDPTPLLFDETHSAVVVQNGLFNVLIGSESGGVPDSALDAAEVYLGISINGGAELSPRPRIASNPHAIKSRSAEQLVKPGSFEAAAVVDGSGQVGVGTASPQATLDVASDGGTILLPRKSAVGDPAGIDGMIYYNTADGKFRGFENGAWGDLRDGSGSASDPCNCPTNPWTLIGVINTTPAAGNVEVGSIDITDNSKEYLIEVHDTTLDFTVGATPAYAVSPRIGANSTIQRYTAAVQDNSGAWRTGNADATTTYPNRIPKGAAWNPAGANGQMFIVATGSSNVYARVYADGTVRLFDSHTGWDGVVFVFSRTP